MVMTLATKMENNNDNDGNRGEKMTMAATAMTMKRTMAMTTSI